MLRITLAPRKTASPPARFHDADHDNIYGLIRMISRYHVRDGKPLLDTELQPLLEALVRAARVGSLPMFSLYRH